MVRPLVLCILDGWGMVDPGTSNQYDATATAEFFNHLWQKYPHCRLSASGKAVGLPDSQMGNSEIGHMTIGLGRVMDQDLPRCSRLFTTPHEDETNSLFQQKSWHSFKDEVQNSTPNAAIHLIGLFSEGGVHSHMDHWYGALSALGSFDRNVMLHLISDGRDTSPKAFLHDLEGLIEVISRFPKIKIATIGGRYFAMDRDKRWDRVEKGYRVIVEGEELRDQDIRIINNPIDYVNECYSKGITDEFLPPVTLQGYSGIKPQDHGWVLNFRKDRITQLSNALFNPTFNNIARHRLVPQGCWIGMKDFGLPINKWLYPILGIQETNHGLGQVISDQGLRQLRIAETEKYAHVTYFFNGGDEVAFHQEERILVPSSKVATYDLDPSMGARDITQYLERVLADQSYAFIVVNYANADMVGHTGNLGAAKKAIAAVDQCLKRLYQSCVAMDYTLIITADHGNAECMYDSSKDQPHTAHTCNRVPFMVINHPQSITFQGGKQQCKNLVMGLDSVAPTILQLMRIKVPQVMTGRSLIEII